MGINISDLPSVSFHERAQLPDAPGIYFALASDGSVLYIGKTISLVRRWLSTSHHRFTQLSALNGVRLAWLLVEDRSLLDSLEDNCIELFTPSLNGSPIERDSLYAKRTYILPVSLVNRLEAAAAREMRPIGRQLEIFLGQALDKYEAVQ